MKLKARALLLPAALCGAAAAQTAPAPDDALSFNVGAVSDYRYRGISRSPTPTGTATSRRPVGSPDAPDSSLQRSTAFDTAG